MSLQLIAKRIAAVAVSCALTVAACPSHATTLTTGPAGGGQPHENHQPGLGINFLISTSGLFPELDSPPVRGDVGEITMFAGNYNPEGWSFLDGQTVPITTGYEQLFSLMGTTFGGDGRTNFQLPDLRGRTPIGAGTGTGLTPRSVGETVGQSQVALTPDQLPSHTHNLPAPFDPTTSAGGNQAHSNMAPSLALASSFVSGYVKYAPYGTSNNSEYLAGRAIVSEGNGPGLTSRTLDQRFGSEQVTLTPDTIPSHTHTADFLLDPVGGNLAHDNFQPSVAFNYIIATTGVFPSRNDFDVAPYTSTSTIDPLVGEVRIFAGNIEPRGWAFADGALLAIAQNQALFSILGTTYGGDGETNFALPDLRGRVPIHVGNGGTDPGLRTWYLGEEYGLEQVTLTLDQLPTHTHGYTIPEPTSLALLGLGTLSLAARRRPRK